MTISESVQSWITLVTNIGVLTGLVLVAMELNQNTDQLSLELEWQINHRMYQNNRDLLGDNPTPIFAKSVTSPEDLTYEEFQVAAAMAFNFLGVWEDRFFLYQEGLLSEQEWKDFVDDDISFTMGYPFARELWRTSKGLFEPEFVQYVDKILPGVNSNANYQWYLDTLKGLSTN